MVNNAPEKMDAPGIGADLSLLICNSERRWGSCALFFLRRMLLFPSRKAATAPSCQQQQHPIQQFGTLAQAKWTVGPWQPLAALSQASGCSVDPR